MSESIVVPGEAFEARLASQELSPIEKLADMVEYLARTGYLGMSDTEENNNTQLRENSFRARLARFIKLTVLTGRGDPDVSRFYLNELPGQLLALEEVGSIKYPPNSDIRSMHPQSLASSRNR